MSGRLFTTIGVAMLVLAGRAGAQERGTVELGAFGSSTSFGGGNGMNRGWGAGARVGAFLHPLLSLEFEGSSSRSSRNFGLQSVNSATMSARALTTPFRAGRLSVLLGAGVDHFDTYFVESYGAHGLLGAKVQITDGVALRVDGIRSWLSNASYQNSVLHAGISMYRNPFGTNTTEYRTVTMRAEQRPDSVSAWETRRLRAVAVNYQALRDSLNHPTYRAASSAAALATMMEMIYFKNDESVLSDSAKKILEEKVTVFRANPAMKIVITGFASQPGTDAYNMALGTRRAEAAKAYLVSMGVDQSRIEIATKGSGELVVEGPGELADAENRRGQFRLLIADPYLAAPRKP